MDTNKYTDLQSAQHSISFQAETLKKWKNLVEARHVRNVVKFEVTVLYLQVKVEDKLMMGNAVGEIANILKDLLLYTD